MALEGQQRHLVLSAHENISNASLNDPHRAKQFVSYYQTVLGSTSTTVTVPTAQTSAAHTGIWISSS